MINMDNLTKVSSARRYVNVI